MKKRKLKKKKQKSLAQLKKQAWALMSEIVRRRAAINGIVSCVTCGIRLPWNQIQAGHFWPKSKGLQYWFYEKNVHPQCVRCNLFDKEMAKIEYYEYMVIRYGVKIIPELRALPPIKPTRFDYFQSIQQLTNELETLKNSPLQQGSAV